MPIFFNAITMLPDKLEWILDEVRPDCIVANMFFIWATDTASKFGILRDVLKRRAWHIGPVSLCNQEVKDKAQRVKEESIDKAQWDTSAAAKFGIPRLVFHWTSFFAICAMQNLRLYKPHREVSSDDEPFFVHDLPRQIKLTKMQLSEHEWNKAETDFARLRIRIRESKQ
ncbi:hypothetical protein Vadar_029404 [Vaccinium darrowii]|uniref:Uncharacterized protein n=1 Tax=Vaccinium darrowii TaxID=229202 RepID=A0ACB7X4Z2_9ERIC|nr:hypothetical protein Vadar_029404 [Vaccinium darrowii]